MDTQLISGESLALAPPPHPILKEQQEGSLDTSLDIRQVPNYHQVFITQNTTFTFIHYKNVKHWQFLALFRPYFSSNGHHHAFSDAI